MVATAIRKAVHVRPNRGRTYAMGPVRAIFKADGEETRDCYSVSEWWLEPKTKGPGAHAHPDDDVFYVLEGTMSFFVGDHWVDAEKGTLLVAPGGMTHDFENRTSKRAGVLNVSVPGGFEPHMPGIAEWFRKRSPADARTVSRTKPAPRARAIQAQAQTKPRRARAGSAS